MSHGPTVFIFIEPELLPELPELELPLEPELLPELPELELPLEPELPPELPELEPPLELELSTIVPMVPCGVRLKVFPETQYGSMAPSAVSVNELFPVVYIPFVTALTDTNPSPPAC